MRQTSRLLASFACLMLVATSAAAQERSGPVPAPGMIGVGASVATSWPGDPSFTGGLSLAANAEGYLTRRVSIRGQVNGAWWDIQGRGFNGTTSPLALDANVVYNFEGGRIHPFVTGGVGLYRYRFEEGATNSSANKAGLDVGGGVEYFVQRHLTMTGELLFHDPASPVQSRATIYNTTNYWTFTVGVKKYFR
jgi:opacity protein-like surface antigen